MVDFLIGGMKSANESNSYMLSPVKKSRHSRIRRGDVFTIGNVPTLGLGQVLVDGNVIYVYVVDAVLHNIPDEREAKSSIIAARPILCGWTLDALVYHGDWKVIGNCEVLKANIPKPCYKVGVDGIVWIEDFTGKLLRPASEHEQQVLEFRTTIAPIRFENAYLHHINHTPPKDTEIKIHIDHINHRARLVGSSSDTP